MIRRNKTKLILSSLVTLLPMAVGLLLWDRLPERFATHWGLDGQPDSLSGLPFAVFGLPLILLAVHWLCIFVTAKDPKNRNRNHKPFGMVLWIIPIISNLSCAWMTALALGAEVSAIRVMNLTFGLLFLVIGNYLPKCRQNYTIGIKVYWTYTSQENWNATHRFGGRVWVAGGLLLLLSAFGPEAAGIVLLIAVPLALVLLPIGYACFYYRGQKKRGDTLLSPPNCGPRLTKNGRVFRAGFIAVVVLVCGLLLFTGNIRIAFGETAFTIEASYYDDLTVEYAAIETVEYREGNMDGIRTWGVGSFRLLMGTFQNAEFGSYTRYTYYNPGACIVLTSGGRVLVLSGKDAEQTREIYQELLQNMGESS